ncbi:hypothetical protein [Desulfobacter sp.]|uniref:hypothetical protein n=1 Tax=Desulfobacter sp. TaxID=2294 RepID=UPI000E8DA756|nr:hypothetical protein [Desulfobacter sp.]HBT88857.1 hypothetical protein [Desulfobacter sp.]
MTEYQISSDINERSQQREAVLDAPVIRDRDQAREKALWDHYIQPVIDEHFKGKYQYKYFEEPTIITNRDIDSMLRTTMGLCMDGDDLIFPTDYFEKHVLRPLRNGITTYTRNKEYGSVDLKELFEGFLGDLFDNENLPIYLYFLDGQYGPDGLWEVASSDGTKGQESTGDSVFKSESNNDIAITHSALSWQDISISVVNDFEVSIQPKDETTVIRRFNNLGFDDGRSPGKPVRAWKVFITALTQKQGAIPCSFKTKRAVEKIAQELRKKFRALFPKIGGDPIPFDKKKHAYQVGFSIK